MGIITLNEYLKDLTKRELLLQAKFIFKKMEKELGQEGIFILAFIHYLDGEF